MAASVEPQPHQSNYGRLSRATATPVELKLCPPQPSHSHISRAAYRGMRHDVPGSMRFRWLMAHVVPCDSSDGWDSAERRRGADVAWRARQLQRARGFPCRRRRTRAEGSQVTLACSLTPTASAGGAGELPGVITRWHSDQIPNVQRPCHRVAAERARARRCRGAAQTAQRHGDGAAGSAIWLTPRHLSRESRLASPQLQEHEVSATAFAGAEAQRGSQWNSQKQEGCRCRTTGSGPPAFDQPLLLPPSPNSLQRDPTFCRRPWEPLWQRARPHRP